LGAFLLNLLKLLRADGVPYSILNLLGAAALARIALNSRSG
jgi:hypothetical protein